MTLGSFFDGIGGWLLAARHAGVTPVWASEIELFPCSVTARHFPAIGECPNAAVESSLSQILQPMTDVSEKYYLSPRACQGILRRAKERGKELPEELRIALELQSTTSNIGTM